MKLLIIEDEITLNKTMTGFLTAAGYLCETVTNYNDAIEKIDLYEYDCIVLDIMLPGGSGLELLQYLKTNKKNDGVIIISAKDSLDDKITGLQLGADDYLTKPFHLPELSMRVAAIIRRKKMDGHNILNIGNWLFIDTIAQKVTVQQQEIELTQKEYQLLLFFVVNKNRVLSKSAIAQHLWGDDMDLADHYDFIYTHIKNLRKKMMAAGGEDCIRSIYGAGYKMQVD
ncbi:MAG: response regulator transcription factor [Hydrotalea flava]|uniref:response regulator transcription factor n=1 Tax=Hydrotalea TaxID=1004300 RepID=UPI00082AF23E|nr:MULTISPECIES: response regulator transcription factor [Hydrotalea]MBY0348078.1 response regulator transcription factor [Hydrotalea flava]RTL51222.1 MAG: response regulator [Sphingobacteriales bacterium]RWZ85953.1 MAG: response regulator [Hydrotalea sp. AMD]